MKKLSRKKTFKCETRWKKFQEKGEKCICVFSSRWKFLLKKRSRQEIFAKKKIKKRRICENQVKKMFLCLKKKIGKNVCVHFFPSEFFFSFEKKSVNYYFVFWRILCFWNKVVVYLQENFYKKLKKVLFSQIQKNSPRNIFTNKTQTEYGDVFPPPLIIQTKMYVFMTIWQLCVFVPLNK